jgi:hypothetical protein
MVIDVSFVTGSNLHSVDHRVKGTVALSGVYDLTVMGVTSLLAINSSATNIQTVLQSSLQAVLKGRVLLIDELAANSSHKKYRIVYPVSLGAVPSLVLNTQFTLGDNIRTSVSMPSVGSYEPLKGDFNLTINGQTTSPLMYNATAVTIRTGLQALNVASNVSVSRYEGIIDNEYEGFAWNVTFEHLRNFDYYGVFAIVIKFSMHGSSVVRVEELQSGRGPLMPVEMTFDGQHLTENRYVYAHIYICTNIYICQ